MALADAVAAEHGDALAEPQLEVERVGQPVQLELLDDHRPLAGAGAAEAHVDALLAHLRRSLVASRRTGAAGSRPPSASARRCRRSSPAGASRRRASSSRLRSSSYQRAVACRACSRWRLAGLGVAGEAAAVGPRALGLDGDDLGRRGGEQLAVVADEEDRLAASIAARAPATAWPGRRGSCRARRAAGRRRRRAAAPRGRCRFCSPPENVRSGRSATSSRSSADGPGQRTRPSAPRRRSRRGRPSRRGRVA